MLFVLLRTKEAVVVENAESGTCQAMKRIVVRTLVAGPLEESELSRINTPRKRCNVCSP